MRLERISSPIEIEGQGSWAPLIVAASELASLGTRPK
jgi:hypothetical protein